MPIFPTEGRIYFTSGLLQSSPGHSPAQRSGESDATCLPQVQLCQQRPVPHQHRQAAASHPAAAALPETEAGQGLQAAELQQPSVGDILLGERQAPERGQRRDVGKTLVLCWRGGVAAGLEGSGVDPACPFLFFSLPSPLVLPLTGVVETDLGQKQCRGFRGEGGASPTSASAHDSSQYDDHTPAKCSSGTKRNTDTFP